MSNRKASSKSVSMDALTMQRLQHLIASHYSNQVGISDIVCAAVNDMYNRAEFQEHHDLETPDPTTRWG